jgi:hypothetical protein
VNFWNSIDSDIFPSGLDGAYIPPPSPATGMVGDATQPQLSICGQAISLIVKTNSVPASRTTGVVKGSTTARNVIPQFPPRFTLEDTEWTINRSAPIGYYRSADSTHFVKCEPGSYCQKGLKYPCPEGYFGSSDMLTSPSKLQSTCLTIYYQLFILFFPLWL